MLHGCTQNPDDFAAGTKANDIADSLHAYVLYPAQAQSANMQKCWNWFQPADQRRNEGEPSLIADMTRHVMSEHAIDPKRVYVAGLSAGGAMAVTMATTYPDLYAAAGVHSGLPHGAAHDMMSAFSAMRSGAGQGDSVGTTFVPTIVFHGDRDTTVHPCNGAHVIEQSKTLAPAQTAAGRPIPELPPRVETGQVPGGHAYTRTIYPDADGASLVEHWVVHGAGHAWSGGDSAGSYTDPKGPDATREMMRFFLDHPQVSRH
jgi:poly(hydroxyalkanoate) depolymerase family esterase